MTVRDVHSEVSTKTELMQMNLGKIDVLSHLNHVITIIVLSFLSLLKCHVGKYESPKMRHFLSQNVDFFRFARNRNVGAQFGP